MTSAVIYLMACWLTWCSKLQMQQLKRSNGVTACDGLAVAIAPDDVAIAGTLDLVVKHNLQLVGRKLD